MALSGSKNYTDSVTAAQIVALALRRLGVIDHADSVDSTEEADALFALNLMVKEWSKHGSLDNWLRQTAAVWLVEPGVKSTYSLGPTGDRAAFSWWETIITAGGTNGSTSINIEDVDAVHCVAGSWIGIKLDNGRIFFTQISGSPTTSVGLASAMDGNASSGNKVYIYNQASQISRPVRLLYASRITLDTVNTSVESDDVGGMEAEVNLIGMNEYRSLSQKKQNGPPLSVYYEPTLTNGTLYVWPNGDSGPDYDKLMITYNIYVDDFDATTDNAQFPPEWINTIAWCLAAELGPEYGISEREQNRLDRKAMYQLNEMLDNDVENASVVFNRDTTIGIR